MRESISPTLLEKVARRVDLINHLLDGYKSKRDLKSVLDMSDSTIDQAIRELNKEGIISYQCGDCTVTPYGRLALSEYKRLTDYYDTLMDAKPLLSKVELDTSLGRGVIQDCDVILSEAPNPRAPIIQLENRVKEAESIIALTSVIQPVLFRRVHEFLTEGLNEAELIMDADQVECLFRSYDEMREMIDLDSCTIRWIKNKPGFGIVLIDDNQVWIGIYDENSSIQGAILNNTSSTVEWARKILQKYRSQANLVKFRNASSDEPELII